MTSPTSAAPDAVADVGTTTVRSRWERLRGDGTAVMLIGTAVALIGAYAFQLLGSRVLGPVRFAPVTVLWTVQFLVVTVVMVPVEQLVIRRLALSGGRSAGLRSSSLPLAVLLGGSAVVVAGIAAALLGRSGAGGLQFVLLAAGLVATYTVFAVARGYLAGRRLYERYGVATAAESVARLLLAAGVLVLTTDAAVIGLVLVLAPLAVLLVRPFAAGPHRPGEPGPGPAASDPEQVVTGTGRFLVPLVLANAASQTVLGAGPVVVDALGATAETVSIVFLTFTLFRAPSWLIQSALSRVLPPFTALAETPAALRRWAERLAVAGVCLAAVGGGLGWWLGPQVVTLMVGEAFEPSPALAALVAAGTGVAAATLFSAQILVATGRTDRVAVAWLVALAWAGALLLLPGAVELRVGVAFLGGELAALLIVTVFALSGRPRAVRPTGTVPADGRR